MPAISIVIPTRDRPRFVRQALRSLAAQRFTDFEVIVSDNPVSEPCEGVVEELGDERFRYLRAERPLSMHDNWEAGCAEVSGDYIGVMIDKTVWLSSTLSHAMGVLEETSAAVLSWWDSSFEPYDERSDLTTGDFHAYDLPPRGPTAFSGAEELAEAMSFGIRRGLEGPAYFRGKICFGLYRRDVLDLIRSRVGRLFPPICPDYTSRVGALLTAPSFVDAGVALQLSFSTEVSNGRRTELDPAYARSFLEQIDPELLDRLPIPGLYASPHNYVAHDYLLAEKLGEYELDRRNLTARVREDLDLKAGWPDPQVRRQQYRLLAAAEHRVGRSRLDIYAGTVSRRLRPRLAARAAARELPYRALLRMPRVHRALRRMRGKPTLGGTPEEAGQETAPPGTLADAILAAEAELLAPQLAQRATRPISEAARASPSGTR
jgi:glycosyltransferase involved in cell wall biosynthesis